MVDRISLTLLLLFLLVNLSAQTNIRADSLLNLAKIELQQEQFSKCRELSEEALKLNPDLAGAHTLIGRAYISSAKICEAEKYPVLKYGIIWAAMEEWEKALSKGDSTAQRYTNSYHPYLPEESTVRACFEDRTVEEGDDYFVECWIRRKVKIRWK